MSETGWIELVCFTKSNECKKNDSITVLTLNSALALRDNAITVETIVPSVRMCMYVGNVIVPARAGKYLMRFVSWIFSKPTPKKAPSTVFENCHVFSTAVVVFKEAG